MYPSRNDANALPPSAAVEIRRVGLSEVKLRENCRLAMLAPARGFSTTLIAVPELAAELELVPARDLRQRLLDVEVVGSDHPARRPVR